MNYLEKKKIAIGSIKENHKEFIKINKIILKTQQRFKLKTIMLSLKKLTRFF